MGGVYLVIVEAVKDQRMVRVTELVALILSFVGSLVLVIPEKFDFLLKYFRSKRENQEIQRKKDLEFLDKQRINNFK